jgi:2-C-methyl-D-erythritol 4-phosphate cytidylyltransferase/2-C-methyl-D-erythritol 2,4-cyclodiphosphate synthase
MTRHPNYAAIIVAAGKGERAGLSQPKQFAHFAGKPLMRWSVEAFACHPLCAQVIVVTNDENAARQTLAHISVDYALGGATRQASVASGLALVRPGVPLICVHDAARPGIAAHLIDRLLSALDDPRMSGAIPALAVADTIATGGTVLGDTVPRDGLWRIQTPQAFRTGALLAAHQAHHNGNATDDAQLVRASGGEVAIVQGDPMLEKVTGPGDLERLSRLFASPVAETRTGMGFDVHRLVPGDGVWIGGVLISHHEKLLGHSDADVALHAITDALLGAIAAGDIGDHFPPSDPRWAGARSDQFLGHAVTLAQQSGYAVTHIDCTIICEAPRIGPHRQAIRQRIAAIVRLPVDAVSVKATTTERLGFAGRGEGIAAQAIATVMKLG